MNKGVVVQFFRFCHLPVYNAALGQIVPDGNRVYIVQIVLFLLGIKAVCLNQLGNPALDLGPGEFDGFRASGADDEQTFIFRTAVFLRQPCGGAFVPGMVLHVADYGPFAVHIPIPCAEGVINIVLR